MTPDQLLLTSRSRRHTLSPILMGRLEKAMPLQKLSVLRATLPSLAMRTFSPQTGWKVSGGRYESRDDLVEPQIRSLSSSVERERQSRRCNTPTPTPSLHERSAGEPRSQQ
ncbi:hypothetical protein E2C01_041889 [Portunus trituberculatus]|uniref:Uncharacterized protein n=1 Tax=Portunus trituberculatus TaxID=210409 RepID=A0A5B7FUY5_PORTR|nr:hypothetical protein [Portunus trituberculatus]